jgi:putative ABC transport system permease protein
MRPPQFVPPRLPMRFFRAICKADFLEEIEGDLLEIYEQKAQENSPSKLRWLFIWEITRLIRPKLLKSVIPSSVNPFFMIQDHLKVSFRNMRKYKTYTSINLLGLTLGIAASVLLFLVVRFERSFDDFHANGPQLYAIGESESGNDLDFVSKVPLAPTLKEQLPEVVLATRFGGWDNPWLETEHGRVNEMIKLVDPDFAEMFSFKVKEGDLGKTLQEKNQIAITESVAKKLFGDEPAMGKRVNESKGNKVWTIGAVLEDVPSNSSIQLKIVTGWPNIPGWLRDPEMANWYNTFMPAYVMLDQQITSVAITDKLKGVVNQFFDEELRGSSIELVPLAEYRRLNSDNDAIIDLLVLVAIIIISIASVNFINLSTAQALARLKEVSIRKVLGSTRRQVVSQFLAESIIVNLAAATLAWALIYISLPLLEERFSIALGLTIADYLILIGLTISFSTVLGLVSGLFPAYFVVTTRARDGLSQTRTTGSGGVTLRKSLLVFQFAASTFMIVGTLVVWKQIDFMKKENLKFADDQLVAVDAFSENFQDTKATTQRIRVWADDYAAVPDIKSVSFASNVPGRYWDNYNRFGDKDDASKVLSLKQVYVPSNYFETAGIKIIEGRSFDKDIASDSTAILINKKAMEALGWSSIEGKYLCEGAGKGCVLLKVIGVTDDYYYQSLKQPIEQSFNYVLVRFAPGSTGKVLERLESDWQALDPLAPFSYFFLDDEFAQMYAEQERIGFSAALFSMLGLLIASLGLVSVASFIIRRKRKEISIRKVMGASIGELSTSLSKSYLLLVAIAFIIAVPVAYYLMDNFLQGFAYHIALDPAIFVGAGGLVLLFALVSVGLIVWRAAKENPVLALRDE